MTNAELKIVPCDGCGKDVMLEIWNPCMECCRARQKGAMNHKCCCGKKKRENPEIHRVGSRTWRTCDRCLASTGNIT